MKPIKILKTTLIYLAGSVLGMVVIFAIQYHANKYMLENGARAAEQYAASHEVENGFLYMHVNVFFSDGQELTEVLTHSEEPSEVLEQYLALPHRENSETAQAYLIMWTPSAKVFSAVCCTPVYAGGALIGQIYLVRTIQYLPYVVLTFWIIYSALFVSVLVCMAFVKRNNAKVNQIYRSYLANVSHELKSPIASIQAIAETLNEGLVKDDETRTRYYGIILRETRHLRHSVLQILELSKLQEQRVNFCKEEVSASDALGEILARYASICEDMGMAFVVDAELKDLPLLYTNCERVAQLLEILLENAVKFTDVGGEIRIAAKQRGTKAVFAVSDTGCGIEEADLPHIFERFYRSNRSQNEGGTGLGLAIAKEITDGLEEKIWAESTAAKGSCFYFTVELAAAQKRHKRQNIVPDIK